MSKLFDSDDESSPNPPKKAPAKVPAFRPKATFQPPEGDGPMFANPIVGAGAPPSAQSQQQLPGATPAMPVNIVQQYVDSTNAAAAAAAANGTVAFAPLGPNGTTQPQLAAPAAAPTAFDTPAPSPTLETPAKAMFAHPPNYGVVAGGAAAAPAAVAPQQQQYAPTAPIQQQQQAYDPNAALTGGAAPNAGLWGNMTDTSANFLAQSNPWGGPQPTAAASTTSAPSTSVGSASATGSPTYLQQQQVPQQQQYAAATQQQQQYAQQQAYQQQQFQQQQMAAAQQQQMGYAPQQQQQPFVPVAAPMPVAPLPPAPTLSNAVWPADLPPLPPAPTQGAVAELSPLPPAPTMPTNEALKNHLNQTTNDTIAWESFLQLRKQLEEAHQHTINLHAQISQIQLSHEKEAAQFREAAQARIETQGKELAQAVENYNTAVSKIDNLSSILSKKAEQVLSLEQRVHELSVENAAAAQKIAHTEDRARVADAGRQVAEVRQRELELTLEHTSELVVNLRRQMQGSHEEKTKAIHEQYHLFEQYRQQLINYYNERERKMAEDFNLNVKQVQALMDIHVKEREEKISKHWKDTILTLEAEYHEIKKTNEDLVRKHKADMEEHKRNETLEKDRWISHLRSEMALLEQRHKEREDHVLTDIARRERELSEREQRSRVQRAQDEQEAKINLMSKEAELKAYYEKLAEDMRKTHDDEREKTSTSFRDQIQQLQNQHLNNERELERMHREKEREMAQRYRIAGYEIEDQKNTLDLQNVSTKTQSSLLSKFDSIEAKQRERAEQTRQAIKTSTSLSGIGTTAGLSAATGLK